MDKNLIELSQNLFSQLSIEFKRRLDEAIEEDFLVAEALATGKIDEYFASLKPLAKMVVQSGVIMGEIDRMIHGRSS